MVSEKPAINVYINVLNLFKFVVDYNKSNQNIINNINLSRLYSTPYIQDDYWVINDIKSMVKATGEDGGNPNIIMIYNDVFYCIYIISFKNSLFVIC